MPLDDTEDQIDNEEIENQDAEYQEDDQDLDDDADDSDDDEEGGLVITIGDEEPENTEPAPDWVRELRQTNRDLNKQLKEERAKSAQKVDNNTDIVLGDKPIRPTLESVDHDPDKHEEALDEYETALARWNKDKSTVADQEATKQNVIDKANDDHQASLKVYNTQKVELNVKEDDFVSAQGNVIDGLSDDQQGLILAGADNPAKVVLGLGTNPAALKKLAAITHLVKFAVALGRLEMTMKTKRKGPPLPEGKLETSNTPISGSGNRALEKARAKAEKTGDRTEVLKLMREQRRAG